MNPQQAFCQPLASHAIVTPGPTIPGTMDNSKLDEESDNSSTEDDMSEDTLTVEDDPATEQMSKLSAIQLPSDGMSHPPRMVPTSIAQDGGHMAHVQHLGNGSMRTEHRNDNMDDDRKKEHKKRSKNWTRAETLSLIQARAELDEKFRKTGRKVPLWDDISCTLRRAGFNRDGQQCKDKWEKLMAGYKEVRDGTRDKADHPFYEELHPLLSWKPYKRENNEATRDAGDGSDKRVKLDTGSVTGMPSWKQSTPTIPDRQIALEVEDARKDEPIPSLALQSTGSMSVIDLAVIQELLETIIMRQQRFFKELLDAVEQKEQYREQMRHAREEKWRAEERAQRYAFNNAMLMLTQRLLGERATMVSTAIVPIPAPGPAPGAEAPSSSPANPKKRSKNWKKSEVFHLIRFRREMESKFVKSTRRAGLWEELGEKLSSLGINRDGKQCREKWDKLMAEFKDVMDGRKDKEESPYFAELTTFLGKSKEVEIKSSLKAAKEELGEI